jgi:hypothetical protein
MKTAGICLTFIYLASLGGYIAVVLECGQCLVFYGDLMDDESVIAKVRDKRHGVDADAPGKGKVDGGVSKRGGQ